MTQSRRQGGIQAQSLAEAALQAMRAGDAPEARRRLEDAVRLDPTALGLHLNLAAACRAIGDLPAAMQALEGALVIDPRNFPALLMKASILERQGKPRLAGSAYALALSLAPPLERLDPATRRAAEHGQAAAERHRRDLADTLSAAAAAAGAEDAAAKRLTIFAERLAGRRAAFRQRPAQFDFPHLPSIEFYDRGLFPWLARLEAGFEEVRAEFLAALGDLEDADGFTPYVDYPEGVPLDQWAELNKNPRWSAYHLWKDGRPVEAHAARCPKTMALLESLPQPHVAGRSPAAMFSLLKPKTTIPPHTGVSNTRLVVHLPLVVPPGCGFRVGSETRGWTPGEAFVFDDTIEHEAWNGSDTWRAVFIFDVWSPFLSEAETAGIIALTEALDAFHGGRPDPASAGL